jgi:hypothetical protein
MTPSGIERATPPGCPRTERVIRRLLQFSQELVLGSIPEPRGCFLVPLAHCTFFLARLGLYIPGTLLPAGVFAPYSATLCISLCEVSALDHRGIAVRFPHVSSETFRPALVHPPPPSLQLNCSPRNFLGGGGRSSGGDVKPLTSIPPSSVQVKN